MSYSFDDIDVTDLHLSDYGDQKSTVPVKKLGDKPADTAHKAVSNRYGLGWQSTIFGRAPRWTKEPDTTAISRIVRKRLALGQKEQKDISVQFLAEGAYNKTYTVKIADSECLMRVALPVVPRRKTQSETATIEFIRRNTDTPVPRILAFDCSTKNDLHFEWIIMELMPGMTLRKAWRKISWAAKETLVRQLARYQAQLYDRTFPAIGNIYQKRHRATGPKVGPIVSPDFFLRDHRTHARPYGPFKTSFEWLEARIKLVMAQQQRLMDTEEDEDDILGAELTKELATDIYRHLHEVFPREEISEHNMLFHDDLASRNILVDDQGQLTAIIDWECVSAVPRWRACQLPRLLVGRPRTMKPMRDQYGPDDDGEPDANGLDNEGIGIIYWEHLLEYELTELRKLFMQEMAELKPAWIVTMESCTLQADFEKAITLCSVPWKFNALRSWLDTYSSGTITSLSEFFM